MATPTALEAADAYLAAADEAGDLNKQVTDLMDAINAANGVGQDAVTTNAAYQDSLAGISEEVQRQKDEYKKAHDTLDGFTFSLDESTKAGSANSAMLAGVARDAQAAAAAAQYEQDKKTMGAKDATDKYVATLATSRQSLIDQAKANGANADEVQKLADKAFALPTQKQIDILVETANATRQINDWLSIQNGKQIHIAVAPGGAGGITRATGDILPGPPSSKDNMLIHAASGEYVVNARQTSRNRGALEYINSGGVIRGYAGGGMVQPQYVPSYMSAPSVGGKATTYAPVIQVLPERGKSAWQQGLDAARGVRAGFGVHHERDVHDRAEGQPMSEASENLAQTLESIHRGTVAASGDDLLITATGGEITILKADQFNETVNEISAWIMTGEAELYGAWFAETEPVLRRITLDAAVSIVAHYLVHDAASWHLSHYLGNLNRFILLNRLLSK